MERCSALSRTNRRPPVFCQGQRMMATAFRQVRSQNGVECFVSELACGWGFRTRQFGKTCHNQLVWHPTREFTDGNAEDLSCGCGLRSDQTQHTQSVKLSIFRYVYNLRESVLDIHLQKTILGILVTHKPMNAPGSIDSAPLGYFRPFSIARSFHR
jgi:hypothetical protein